jgi:hypothetical protein
MNAGIQAHDDAVKAFQEVKNKNLDFVTYRIDEKFVNVDSQFPSTSEEVSAFNADKKNGREATFATRVYPRLYEEFKKNAKQSRFAVVDWGFTTADGRKSSKLLFIQWCPDSAPVRLKMLTASTAKSFMGVLGLEKKVQANELSDLSYESIQTFAST